MSTLLRTHSLDITESAGSIHVRPRIGPTVGVAAGGAVFGGLMFASGRLSLPDALEGIQALLVWAGAIVGVCCLLLILIVGLQGLKGGPVIDSRRRVVRVGGRDIPFAQLGDIRVERTQLGSRELLGLAVDQEGRTLWLVRGVDTREQPQFDAAVLAIRSALQPGASQAALEATAPTRTLAFEEILLVGLGLIWMISARLMVPDLVIAPSSGSFGFALWGIGAAPLLLGLGALGVKRIWGEARWKQLRGPLTLAVFTLTFAILLRRIG